MSWLFWGCAVVGQPIADPIPGLIPWNGIDVKIEAYATIPASASGNPLARLAMLRPVPDGSNRLFVNDMRGILWVIGEDRLPRVFLDLRTVFPNFKDRTGFGTGFASFTFHPEFAANGLFYTAHSENAGSAPADLVPPTAPEGIAQQSVITEWKLDDPRAETFSGIQKELLRIDQTGNLHAVQEIAFAPYAEPGDADYALLFITQGDSGSVVQHTPGNTNRPDSAYGSLLRIDPAGSNSRNGRYGIPPGNPLAGDFDPSTVRERYAWGFRNPHRLTWDPFPPHTLYVGDIGEDNVEEVNLIIAGGNYGWPFREGTFLLRPEEPENVYPLPTEDDQPYVYPVAQYDHDDGAAIALGPIVRYGMLPSLCGKLLFADIARGVLFAVDTSALALGNQAPVERFFFFLGSLPAISMNNLIGTDRADVRWGFDNDGNVYVLTKHDGVVWRLFEDVVPGEHPKVRLEGVGDGSWELRFGTGAGACYSIERTQDLVRWKTAWVIRGDGKESVVAVVPEHDRYFLRVRRLPCCP